MKMPSSSARCAGENGNQVWPPGFRFHPTDEELVLYYLKRKVCGRRLKLDIIAETDVYKWDPEDLPGLSKLKTGDRLWFFFSPRDRKYPNGGRSNRATHHGYWKATGKDRHIMCSSRSVGMKKTLVYYAGRAPTGTRTDWVMHEYILDEEEMKRCKNVGDNYALYKVYKKSGPGPKNGEQYGAPFKEEDWVDEEECVEVGINAAEASTIYETRDALTFSEVEAYKIPEPLDTGPAALVRIESDLNGLVDESMGRMLTRTEIHDLCQLQSADFSNSFHQTIDNETPSTIYDPSGNDTLSVEQVPCVYPAQQYDNGNSFYYSLPSASQAAEARDINSGVITSDPDLDELNKFLNDGDFLEANDLLGPEAFPSVEDNPLANIKFDDTYVDGLGEWELFADASMFLHDTATNDVSSVFDGDYGMVNNLGYQMQPQLDNASFTTDALWGHDNPYRDRPSDFPSGSTNGGNGNSSVTNLQDNQNYNERKSRPQNRVTSAVWDFVESIPTTPASASENILFSKALERVSSFSRTRLSARKSLVSAGTEESVIKSRSRSVLLFSIVGALCAMLWVFMTKTAVTFL